MTASAPLRVRKDPFEVELALAGRPPRRVELFLAEHGSHEFARQRVGDLLEHGGGFLPACDLETGRWETFNARAVAWIGMSRDSVEAEGGPEELFEHRLFVRLTLTGGSALDGELLYSAPDGEARLVDYLNRPELFVRLWNGDRVYLVRKESIVMIVESGPEV
jgi:PAS domain-containing protein